MHGTIAEMTINPLLCQENFMKLNYSNMSFYLVTSTRLNGPYITINAMSKI